MSYPREVIVNADEQMVSADINNAQGMSGQEFSDVLARLFAGNRDAGATSGPLAGLGALYSGVVFTGLNVVPSAGLTVQVNPGLGFDQNGAPPALGTLTQSGWRWIKLTAQQAVTLVPTASNQIALIQATDGTVATGSQSRNVWDPPTNTVKANTVNKEVDPVATITVKYSTTALPAPDAGNIPLAYVYVPASASNIPNSQIVDARPLYVPGGYNRQGAICGLALMWAGTGSGALADSLRVSGGQGWASGLPIVRADQTYSAIESGAWASGKIVGDATVANGFGTGAMQNLALYGYLVPTGVAPLMTQDDANYAPAEGGSAFVLCTTPPDRLGRNSAAITIPAGQTPFNIAAIVIPGGEALFVGSLMTDVNGHVIPFDRSGDHVILSFLSATFPPIAGGHLDSIITPSTGGIIFSTADGAGAKAAAFSYNGGPQVALPASALRVLADVLMLNNDDANPHTLFGLNPQAYNEALPGGWVASGAGNTADGSWALIPSVGLAATSNAFKPRLHVRPDTTGKVWFAVNTGESFTGASVVAVEAHLCGYVEQLQRMTF